jgi:hypothetical protein
MRRKSGMCPVFMLVITVINTLLFIGYLYMYIFL